MSDDPSVAPSVSSTNTEGIPARYIPIIDKSLPRPAPTFAYSWKERNPQARVLYIRDHNEANSELSKLPHGPQAFGFDLEWKPNYFKGSRENPVALIQLSNDEKIFLLQVSSMKEFPTNLTQLLGDPLIVKSGIGIEDDAKKLYRDCRINMYNCVDLSMLARTVDNARWQGKYNSSLGLARLVESYEYRLLGKGKVTRSNWEANLNPLQIEYASNDAHAGYVLYRTFESMQATLPYPPEHVWFSFNVIAGQLLDVNGHPWHPKNPRYDPGPPPPPKIPRESKEPRKEVEKEDVSISTTRAPWRGNRGGAQGHSNGVRPPPNFDSAPRYGGSGSVSTYAFQGGRHSYQTQLDARRFGQHHPYILNGQNAVQTGNGPSSRANNAPTFLNAQRRAIYGDGMGMRQDGSSRNNRYPRHQYPSSYPTDQDHSQGHDQWS